MFNWVQKNIHYFLLWYIGSLSVKGGKVVIGKIQGWKKRLVWENPSRVSNRFKEGKILIASKQKRRGMLCKLSFLK